MVKAPGRQAQQACNRILYSPRRIPLKRSVDPGSYIPHIWVLRTLGETFVPAVSKANQQPASSQRPVDLALPGPPACPTKMAQHPTIRESRQYGVHEFGAMLPLLSILRYLAIFWAFWRSRYGSQVPKGRVHRVSIVPNGSKYHHTVNT